MEKFLPYYERELGSLRRLGREFTARFPKLAGQLLMTADAGTDPHVEHLIQSIAFLNARTAKLLDNQYAVLTEAMLGMLYPHYLRPIPACSIARIDYGAAKNNTVHGVTTVPRGTEMKSAADGVSSTACRFRTSCDITVAPLRVSAARFEPFIRAPATVHLPDQTTASITLEFESTSINYGLEQPGMACLRLFIEGEPSFRAALRDTLLMSAVGAYVEVNRDGRWIGLDAVPVTAAGFADTDALTDFDAAAHPAYRLLSEYFSFPEKFYFIDIDLAALAAVAGISPAPCRQLRLHLALGGVRADSQRAALLQALDRHHLLPGCAPVVNLFRQAATPIKLTHTTSAYPLLPDQTPPSAFEIYSVDAVRLLRGASRENDKGITEFVPFYSLRHGDGERKGHYWLTRRDEDIAAATPGHEMSMVFIDRDFTPVQMAAGSVAIDLTCSNRDVPATLRQGLSGGELFCESATGGHPIRLLRRPTASRRFASERGTHWGLIAHLSLNHRTLAGDSPVALAALLRLYAPPGCAASQRQIDGIVALSQRAVSTWMRGGDGCAYVSGLEVSVTLDESAFAGSSLHLFIAMLDHLFGLTVHMNSFTQLRALSQTSGKELMTCLPRNGALTLA
jgi:type VI secretion system protein ImpG